MDRPTFPRISTEAILRSRTGHSLARPDEPITAENLEAFSPSEQALAVTIRRLQELGFEVAPSGVTLTILGEPVLFERVFGVKLVLEGNAQEGFTTVRSAGHPVIPEALEGLVEEIGFSSARRRRFRV